MGKKALALGGGIDQVKLIKEFKSRGFYVIVADKDINAPGKKYADEFYPISTMEKEKLLELAQKEQISTVGVMSADQPLLTAAFISEQMGLYYPISYEQAKQVTNKSAMKRKLIESVIPTPKHITISSKSDFYQSEAILKFPLVIKPVDSSAARGVFKIKKSNEFDERFYDALQYSNTKVCIVEEYLDGHEISIDAVVKKGKATIIMISDNYSLNYDYKIGLMLRSKYPPSISKEVENKIIKIVNDVVRVFRINDSLLFLQMIVRGNSVYIIEFSTRNAGGSKHKFIEIVTGEDIVGLYLDLLLKENVDKELMVNRHKIHVSVNYIYCKKGHLSSIKGIEELYKQGVIFYFELYKPLPNYTEGFFSGADRIGVFIIIDNAFDKVVEKNRIVDNTIKLLNNDNEDIMVHGLYE